MYTFYTYIFGREGEKRSWSSNPWKFPFPPWARGSIAKEGRGCGVNTEEKNESEPLSVTDTRGLADLACRAPFPLFSPTLCKYSRVWFSFWPIFPRIMILESWCKNPVYHNNQRNCVEWLYSYLAPRRFCPSNWGVAGLHLILWANALGNLSLVSRS